MHEDIQRRSVVGRVSDLRLQNISAEEDPSIVASKNTTAQHLSVDGEFASVVSEDGLPRRRLWRQ